MSELISEEKVTCFITKVKRLVAYQEIQNNMGRCIAAFNFQNADEVLKHFCLDSEDVCVEYADEGIFTGKEAVKAIINEIVRKPERGFMLDMQLTTPIIEVAEDLETARAVWWCPGAGSIKTDGEASPKAIWAWGNLGVDFICVQGEWKIWHLHYFRVIKCDYKKGWVEDTSMINRPNVPVNPLSKPGSYHNPYSPLSIRDGIPAAPRPYKTWSNDEWMLNRNKDK